MKIHEIKEEENKAFKPIRIELTFESLDEIKSLIGYLNLPEEIVKQYYYSLNYSKYYPWNNNGDFISISITDIRKSSNSLLIFLNNIALAIERSNE